MSSSMMCTQVDDNGLRVLIQEDVCVGLLLPPLVYILPMTIALDWGGYLLSFFVVIGGKDMMKPTLVTFSRVCRAGEYIVAVRI